MSRLPLVLGVLAAVATGIAGCAGVGTGPAAGGEVRVVAAENFWGSITRQLGGAHATVRSIIANPAQDPHSYEPATADARAMATAQLAIVNGIGYDPWAPKLLAANPVSGRLTLTVGGLLGLREGENPHRWYDPADVERVAAAVSQKLSALAPRYTAYFARRLREFDTAGLGEYHRLIAAIRARYAGVPVGASESLFALQAPALGLRLLTPTAFMNAVSEGNEVTARDTVAAEQQVTGHMIRVWIYDDQNVTPEIQRLNALARASAIPIARVSETLSPAGDSFQQWQVTQLRGLRAALRRATGR